MSIAQWRDDKRVITLQANLSASETQTIAETVHKSTDDEVHRSLDTTFSTPLPGLQSPRSTIVAGTLADGTRWDIEVSPRDPADESAGYIWWIGQPGDSAHPPRHVSACRAGHRRSRLSSSTVAPTYSPRCHDRWPAPSCTSAPTAWHRRCRRCSTSIPDLGDLFTATVFFEPVPFTAHIADGNGVTVASWPQL